MDLFNTEVLNDHDLLLGGVADAVEENKASARRWARLVAYFRRHEVSERLADPDDHFALNAREDTAVEVSGMWAISDSRARHQLNVALFLQSYLPYVWELCLAGQLDAYRAGTIADIARHRLDRPEDWARLAERLDPFLKRHLRHYPELDVSMVTCTIRQLRNKLNYATRVLRPAEGDEAFHKAHDERAAWVFEGDDGTATLSIANRIDDVLLARHRLRLGAKQLRAAGDPRTLDQLSADLALDLLIGRGEGLPAPAFARPIINLTVPWQTLAGLRDDPGQLSGGAVIPAALARIIATSEGATWFRLLTDPEGDPVALSTKSYQPTTTIWRHVVATQPTCAHPACDRPATECELDHVVPWPTGATSTDNLQPLCKLHHKAKHARAIKRPDLDWEYEMAS